MNARVALIALLAFAALTLGTTLPAPAAASAPPQWGKPTPIGPDLPSSWFPDIQADPAGTVRLVWGADLVPPVNDAHANTGAVEFSQLGQSGWSKPADIAVMDASITLRPIIVSDGQYVHLVYRRGGVGVGRIYYSRAAIASDLRDAHSWSEPQLISDTEGYYAQLVALPDNSLVIVYNALSDAPKVQIQVSTATSTTTLSRRTQLFARRSTDHGITWSSPVHVSQSDQRVARTALAMSSQGEILVSWDEGYDNITGQGDPVGGGTAVSTDGGVTWQNQQEIRSPRGPFEQTAVAFGASGALLVYRSINQPQLLYRQSTDDGRTWGEEQVVPQAVARPYSNKHNFDKISLAADGDGRLLLAYVGQDPQAPNGLGVFVATFAGDTWSTPVEIAAPVGYPEYPRVAVALGNQIQVVYFVRDSEYMAGHYTLWSVAGQSDAKALAPVKPVPVVMAAPVVQPTLPPVQILPYPTITAPAPLTAAQRRWLGSPQAEVNGPAFATFKAVLPALLLILIVTALVRRLSSRRA